MSEIKLHKAPRRWPLVLIAIDKFVKAAGLAAISFVIAEPWNQRLQDWIDVAQTHPHGWLVSHALLSMEKALGIGKHTTSRVFVFIFIGLYLIEGVGLIFEKKWAEWMVVIGTVLFLPLEIIEFCREPRWTMVGVFVINALIAVYLVWRLHRQKVIRKERTALGFPAEPAKGPAKGAVSAKPAEMTNVGPTKMVEPSKAVGSA